MTSKARSKSEIGDLPVHERNIAAFDLSAFEEPLSLVDIGRIWDTYPQKVKARMATAKPCAVSPNGKTKYYDFRTAAQYMSDVPENVVIQAIEKLKASNLPPALQAAFWDGQNKRLKFEVATGDLWLTEDVREVLGEAFKRIKTAVQLWVSTLERETVLSNEQRRKLDEMANALLGDVYGPLVNLQTEQATEPAVKRLDDLGVGRLQDRADDQGDDDELFLT